MVRTFSRNSSPDWRSVGLTIRQKELEWQSASARTRAPTAWDLPDWRAAQRRMRLEGEPSSSACHGSGVIWTAAISRCAVQGAGGAGFDDWADEKACSRLSRRAAICLINEAEAMTEALQCDNACQQDVHLLGVLGVEAEELAAGRDAGENAVQMFRAG